MSMAQPRSPMRETKNSRTAAASCGGSGFAFDDFADAIHTPLRFVLQQGEEEIFLGAEMGIERAAGVAAGRGDIFNTAGFETVARKNAAGRFQQSATSGFGALLMLSGRRILHCSAAIAFTRRSHAGCPMYHFQHYIHSCMYIIGA